MSIFDVLGLEPQTIVKFLSRWGIFVTEENVTWACDVIIMLLAFWTIFGRLIIKIVKIVWQLIPWGRSKKVTKYIHDVLDHDFKEYLGRDNKNQYIETQFLSCPPHDYDEPNKATTASTREPMSAFCKRVLKSENPNERLYMVIAGSGMGKTTFMVNLFCRYVVENYSKNGMPFDIRLLRMDGEDIIDRINAIRQDSCIDVTKTILLLDALDENRDAAENFTEFQQKLESAIEAFRFVIITCRDQFFDNEKMIPVETSWISTGRDKNLINYNKIYISPFSNDDVELYLKKKYKGERNKKKRARLIIDKCQSLMARPLLLSYVDDLVDNVNDYKEVSDIYEVLIDKWLQREVNGIKDSSEREKQKDKLYRFSFDIAKQIYSNWKETKKLLISPVQMSNFMRNYEYAETPYDAKRRSLINRNISGEFKFAHKSFLEYFLAKEYFRNPSYLLDFEGMDMARKFFEGMCLREYRDAIACNILEVKRLGNAVSFGEINIKILDADNVDFNHLKVALGVQKLSPTTISFLWKAYNKDLFNFLNEMKVPNLIVDEYRFIDKISPKELLKISSLVSIIFNGSDSDFLPNSYINQARRLSIMTKYNNRIVTSSYMFSRGLSISMNIDNQNYLRSKSNELSRLYNLTSFVEKID